MSDPVSQPVRSWWKVIGFALGIAIAGLVITWFAFTVGVKKVPADPTGGVELVPSKERTSRGN